MGISPNPLTSLTDSPRILMTSLLDQPTTIRPGEELDTTKLEAYLCTHFVGEKGTLQVRQYPSGHSNLTYALRLGSRELAPASAPFREHGKSAHHMGREVRVLSKLHAVYSPAPQLRPPPRTTPCLARRST